MGIDNRRREVLRAGMLAGAVGLAGCLGGDSVGTTPTATDTRTATATATPPAQSGAPETRAAKLAASDGDAGDGFGESIAVRGDTAIVGAMYDKIEGSFTVGAAYVFERDGEAWTQQAKLVPDDASGGEEFGTSVALSGSTALVGAWKDRPSAVSGDGAAYLFERGAGGWQQRAKILPSGDERQFGTAVALEGATALIGAGSGPATVLTRTEGSWRRATTFGHGVTGLSLAGRTAILGYSDDAVTVFEGAGADWERQAELVPENAEDRRGFGHSIAATESRAIVGEVRLDGTGAATVFDRGDGGWSQGATLVVDDGGSNDSFGNAVSLATAGAVAVVGSPRAKEPHGTAAGATYVFRRRNGSWSRAAKLVADDGDAGDFLGDCVAVDASTGTIGAGAPADEHPNGTANNPGGSAYLFTL